MKYLPLLLLVASAFAEDKKPLPEIPVQQQSDYKSAVIKLKDIQIDEMTLQARFSIEEQLKQVSLGMQSAIEANILRDLKLDPAKFAVVYQNEKVQVIAKDGK